MDIIGIVCINYKEKSNLKKESQSLNPIFLQSKRFHDLAHKIGVQTFLQGSMYSQNRPGRVVTLNYKFN